MNFTTDDVIGALKRAVTAKGEGHKQPRWIGTGQGETPEAVQVGDEIVGSYRYSEPTTGQPSCILGWAIFNLDRNAFHIIAEVPGTATSMIEVLETSGYTFSNNARRLMRDTQSNADEGKTWGEAFAHGLTKLAKA